MTLLTKQIIPKFEKHPIHSQDGKGMDTEVLVKHFNPCGSGPWLITDEFMDSVNCQLLVHGADNVNHVRPERLVIFPRTEGVSSSTLRERVLDCLIQMNIDSKKGNTGDKVARFMIELIKKEFRLE